MSYNTDLQSNNADLQSILNTINSLPEAGSGGSGGGQDIQTCRVCISGGMSVWNVVAATVYENGVISTFSKGGPAMMGQAPDVNNVVVGSVMIVYPGDPTLFDTSMWAMSTTNSPTVSVVSNKILLITPHVADDITTISFYPPPSGA